MFKSIKWTSVLAYGLSAALILGVAGVALLGYFWWSLSRGLPDHRQLAEYEPPVTSRIHAGDGSLIGVFARERRMFVPIQAIPDRVKYAFISAEDKTFYEHGGVDVPGILSAVVKNVGNQISGRRPVGASTITQQVAKNFLLTNEVSYERKLKEMILAFRLERAFGKDKLLELYLNEIYLGRGAYGVAAAALNYFDKPLADLTIAEAAYLAALPKAPSNYHPVRNRERALVRRNWVIAEMQDNGYISEDEAETAELDPLIAEELKAPTLVDARYFVVAIRNQLLDQFGEQTLFEDGLSIRTTVEPRLQNVAQNVLREGISDFDRRTGWRGPIEALGGQDGWKDTYRETLNALEEDSDLYPWRYGVVLGLKADQAELGFADGTNGVMPFARMDWAYVDGRPPKKPSDVLSLGDIVLVSPGSESQKGWGLRQLPEVNGALVALDPHTGRVLALVGGFSYAQSRFNRAIQAERQPGSAIKPFIYAAALDSGFTPSSLILDAPFVMEQGPGKPLWKPANYTKRFYGPSTLRLGIEKSRNLMTVRLAQNIGMKKVVDYARRFGIDDKMEPVLAMSLGAGETTPLKLTAAYAMLVNGGKKITPTLIDRVQDRYGHTIYKSDERVCDECRIDEWTGSPPPQLPDERPQVINAQTAYQIVSILEGVVERGTGVRVKAVGKPLAGKTGTTDESRDTWFVGFSPDLAVGVYVGYDTPKSLGRKETGSSVAAPIFRDFMMEALKNQPAIPFRIPSGMRLVRVNAKTGAPARYGDDNIILEAFKPGTEPSGDQIVLDGSMGGAGSSATAGTGGLY